jgi:chromosomal replication initiation ATPase DnaA
MWLCVRLTGLSFPKLGVAFGGRDHTSLMHGRDKALAIMDGVPALKAAALVVLATFGVSE